MKKLLILIGLITSMYAVPPCESEADKVCVYLYKGGMSSEAILVNTIQSKIQIDLVIATLDGKQKEITNLTMEPNQSITLLKSRYDDHLQKPNFGLWKVSYRQIN